MLSCGRAALARGVLRARCAGAPARALAKKAKDGSAPVEKASFDFNENAFVLYNCDGPGVTAAEATRDEMLEAYRLMQRIRRFEIAADGAYKAKLIRGFLHLYNGQEAVCVGMEAALRREDHIITAYRDHGWFMSRGGAPLPAFAELMGRIDGCSKGNGGSMHFYDAANRFYGGNGIVGAQCPIGAGLAFAAKFANRDEVSVTLYGDGAANQGQLFEAFNMAALWKLPAIFVCENNLYGMGTSVERASADREFFKRGDYIPGIRVDGMDMLAVRAVTQWAREHATTTGPVVLEMETYRYAGHSMSDPGTAYRTREEIQTIRQSKDPIERHRRRLLDSGMADANELKQIDKDIKKEIDECVAKAKESPEPSVEKHLFAHSIIETLPSHRNLGCEVPASQ